MTPDEAAHHHHEVLSRRWHELIAELDVPAEPATEIGAELIARYGEPHRTYHDRAHLSAVLDTVDELAGQPPAPATVRLAAWYHDAIYQGRADDEQASARLAEDQLPGMGLAPDQVDDVAAMVRATARHFDPDADHDTTTALLLDADLAVLGADPAAYDAYCEGVRAEHPQVDDEAFRLGRLQVVDALLARDRLFLTPAGFDRFEAAARANLRRERDQLTGEGSPPGQTPDERG
ncbi:MAG: metal-dependent phosphohydrolase [Acidimicrobiales bacterium]